MKKYDFTTRCCCPGCSCPCNPCRTHVEPEPPPKRSDLIVALVMAFVVILSITTCSKSTHASPLHSPILLTPVAPAN